MRSFELFKYETLNMRYQFLIMNSNRPAFDFDVNSKWI